MTPATAALLLSLVGPAAPAAKADAGVSKELIDLLPDDTAGVMVVDVSRTVRTAFGRTIVKLFDTQQRPDQPIHFADLAAEAEWVLLSQFLIDKATGDFALIVRLKAGSDLGKALVAKAKADKQPAEQIGTRIIYPSFRPGFALSMIDDRTLMVVLATGNTPAEFKQTFAAAFGVREPPGPSRELRKLMADGAKDDRPIQLYAHHPTKVALSAYLPLANFGVPLETVAGLGDKLVSYRGGIRMGEAGEVELRFTAKDSDAAKEFLKAYEAADDGIPPFVKEFRASARVVRKGAEVMVTAHLTKATVELVGEKRNK